MSKFKVFGDAVRARFAEMCEGQLFVVDREADLVWGHYLASFPDGTNPIFRKRTEHDCSCCRHFIRDVGHVVGIQNGALTTVWDLNGLPEPFQTVADEMASYVRALPIGDIFLTKEARIGTEQNREMGEPVLTWDHFSAKVPRQFVADDVVARKGTARTTHAMLLRAIAELKPSALQTVLDLIDEEAIYRGAEHKAAVEGFMKLQNAIVYSTTLTPREAAWLHINNSFARIRNTAIGSLIEDLSNGVDMEGAVRSFEAKVAPENYKRPKALITKAMVDAAMKTIAELDLEASLERRHARLSDISVNEVLFVDNSVRDKMKDGIKGLLMQEAAPTAFDYKKATEIPIENFVKEVLPKAHSIQVYVEGEHQKNFVSMTAPVHEDTKRLFKWGNDFGWSYEGNATDSIKERVKRAGGRVEGVALRVSLAWNNFDDLDLHCLTHYGNIYYGNKQGILDVDMNAFGPRSREPVENMRWITIADGRYAFSVNQYTRRESIDVGFTLEVESEGRITTLSYAAPVVGTVKAALVTVKDGKVIEIAANKDMVVGGRSTEKWGIKTLELVKVNALINSPNHWCDIPNGNKHWFFILEGCKNDVPCRGIYNEFLPAALEKHRKVFEVLGDKTKCPVADEQLSGLGFSAGRQDAVTVLATGPGLKRAYRINF